MLSNSFLFLLGFLLLKTNPTNACTIFSCARNGEVFAAANEDDYTPFTRIWYNPRTAQRFGSVCFGAPDMQVAAAMNEYGLFFDFAQASYDLGKLNLKNPYPGFLFWEVLGTCKTVKEALAIITKYDYNNASQVLLADREGNSVLINPNGVVEKNGSFQVNANCNKINGVLSCRRPEIVHEMLLGTKNNSVAILKNILAQTHQEGSLNTLYSTVCDLKRGIIYVYLFHNYEAVYKIDLNAELKKGYRIENLAVHFPTSFAYESYSKNHALYLKEFIFNELTKDSLDATLERYIAQDKLAQPEDSSLPSALLEVALQLTKYAFNEHQNGGMWDYWFSLPSGYTSTPFRDVRLTAAAKLLDYLANKPNVDAKLRHFMYEIYAYINWVQGNAETAKRFYKKSITEPAETYKVSLLRATEMLRRLGE